MKILIRARPNSKEERIEQVRDRQFNVWVKQSPVDGKANEAICRAMARYFNVSRSRVTIVSGRTAKQKIVEIGM